MKTRILSGIVLAVVTLASHLFGGPVLFAVCMVISLIGMMELYRLVNVHKDMLGIVGYITAMLYYAGVYFDRTEYGLAAIVAGFMAVMFVYVARYPKYKANEVMLTYFGIIYLAVMISYIFRVRELNGGIYLVWLIYICSWINDTFAYFTGITLGRKGNHKMTPNLSPKKSFEGLFGGIIGSAVVGAVYGAFAGRFIDGLENSVLLFAIVSAVGAALSVVGDLSASAIKRNYGIKDYGKLIPGHGGILDRYDSVIFTAPVVYYLIEFLNTIL